MNTSERAQHFTNFLDNDPYTGLGPYDADAYNVYNLFYKQSAALSPKNISQSEIDRITAEGAKFAETGTESPDRHELNQDAFDYAFIQYVSASGMNGPDTPLSYALTPHNILSEFSASRPESGLNRILKNAALLEALGANDAIPSQSVAIPIAINKENPAMVIETLKKLIESQSHSPQLTEVVLWTNARFSPDEDEITCREQAETNYRLLRHALSELAKDDSCIQIKTALQVESVEDMTMSKIRQNLMDAIIVMSHKQRRGFNYPVTWLDADIKAISNQAIDNVSSSARHLEGSAVHVNLRYDSGSQEARELGVNDAEKALTVRELLRRKVERHYYLQETPAGEKPRVLGYAEETGLCFPIGTYMMTGGTDVKQPVDESANIMRKKHAQDSMPFVFGGNVASRNIVQKYLLGTPLQYNKSPDQTPQEDANQFMNTKNAAPLLNRSDKITVSARNLVLNVRDFGNEGLINPHHGSYRGLFNDRIAHSTADAPPSQRPPEDINLEILTDRLLHEDHDIAFMYSRLQPSAQNTITEEIRAVIGKLQK